MNANLKKLVLGTSLIGAVVMSGCSTTAGSCGSKKCGSEKSSKCGDSSKCGGAKKSSGNKCG